MQRVKAIHADYPFQASVHENRLFTCSLSQGLSKIEFPLNNG